MAEVNPADTFVEDEALADFSGEPKFLAWLVRGQVHYLRDIRFDAGAKVVIYGYHKDHLEEHAVETVGDNDGELLVKDKFKFEPYDGEAPVGTVVSGAVRDNTRDYDAEARLRAFGAREKARVGEKDTREAPKFDKDDARRSLEKKGVSEADDLPKPRARVRR